MNQLIHGPLALGMHKADEVFTRVAKRASYYGFDVVVKDLGEIDIANGKLPETGTFDGFTIAVSSRQMPSPMVFILLHLFGHSVQCCSPSESEIVNRFFAAPHDKKIDVLADYEFRAAQFGLQLLHETEYFELDQWFTDYVHADHNMVATYYKTGIVPHISTCLDCGKELIKAAPIPADMKPQMLDRTSVAF